MKKIALILFFIITFCLQSVLADDVLKITSANFDTSNALIFLSGDEASSSQNIKNIRLVKLSNPNRVYFDIDSAVLAMPKQEFSFSFGNLKEIKINQFSTNPNVIRVVMYFDVDFNPSKIKVFKVKNNLVVKLKDEICNNSYLQNNYRDEHLSDLDFYEYSSISTQVITKNEKTINQANKASSSNDKVLNQIQQAFEASNLPKDINTVYKEVNVSNIKKDLKLNTKYYLNNVSQKPSGILISGFGSVSVEKPMFLSAPDRVVFDLPNTVVNPVLRNKEFKISDTDFIKIGQFESNKARVVVNAVDVKKYYPIYSKDNQTLLIVNTATFDLKSLNTETANVVSYNVQRVNDYTSDLILGFDSPIIHSVERGANALYVYVFNAMKYNDQVFKSKIKSTGLSESKIELLAKCGLKITVPAEPNTKANVYLSSDGKDLDISIKSTKKQPAIVKQISEPVVQVKRKISSGKYQIVLDPGHGGIDYGAIRSGVNEKDINLDVSKRVEAILAKKGYSVFLTRAEDATLSLQERVDAAENYSSDIFVSIHVNSSERPEITGVETHYYHDYSLILAQGIQRHLAEAIKTSPNRGLFKSKFYVINHTTMPAVLVEIGFISNEEERNQLISERRKQQTANAIAEGIIHYFNSQK